MNKINGTLRENREDKDMEMFMQDLEEDKICVPRSIFTAQGGSPTKVDDEDHDDDVEDDFPEIELDELLDELDLQMRTVRKKWLKLMMMTYT